MSPGQQDKNEERSGETVQAGTVAGGFTTTHRTSEQKRREQELQDRQFYERSLIEATINALVVTDPHGVIVDVNRQMCVLTDCSREQLIGTTFKDYFTDPERAWECVRRVRQEGRVTDCELTLRGRGGRETVVAYNLTTVAWEDGRLRGILAVARDVTEQKRLQRELRDQQSHIRGLIESFVNIMVTIDPDLNIVDVNRQMVRLSGYDREQLIGSAFQSYFSEPEQACEAVRRALREGNITDCELTLQPESGPEILVSLNASVFRDTAGDVRGVFAVARDITVQKAMEQQIRRQNEELAAQNREIQEANRMKSEFLANMSHELRTPLNAIIGFSQLMYDGMVGPVSDEHREYLGDILNSSRHLVRLINDVLDLAKIEAGKMEFRPERVEVENLVAEVCDVLRALVAQKRIELRAEVDLGLAPVVLDPGRFKQVLYNYLSNAIKFTSDEGQVTVRVKAEGERELRLEVEDTGIGIRPEDVRRLFVEFQQLDSGVAKQYQGTGLGLAQTKRLVEVQGGRVGVQSTPGKGSVFFAVLPRIATDEIPEPRKAASVAKATRSALSPSTASNSGCPTILVVDDSGSDRAWLQQTLTRAGYAVEAAATGEEALVRCRAQVFSAIILDLLMPEMDGFEFLRRFRLLPGAAATPVLVWTNKELTAEDYDQLERAAEAVVLKGRGGTEDLLGELRQLLEPAAPRPPEAERLGRATRGG